MQTDINIENFDNNYTISIDDILLPYNLSLSQALEEITNKIQLCLYSPIHRNCIANKVSDFEYIISGYNKYSIVNVEQPIHTLKIIKK